MKRFLLLLAGLAVFSSSFANLTGSGYYRVRNYGSERWASMVDNDGDIDIVAGNADLHALALTKNTEAILSDPGSIVYISAISGNQYDLAAQGISLSTLVNHTINIGENGLANNQTLYRIYGTYSGVTRYIGDGGGSTGETGYATIKETNNPNYMKWYILPVDAATDNYLGVVPNVNIQGNLYTTLFTSFAYEPYSEGVKAYYINRVGFGMAEMIEITGAVPPGSPVVIQCTGTSVSDNKLQVTYSEEALPANALAGTYFNYKYNNTTNRVLYDPETMRVLGTCSDGSLGFVTSDIEAIPANTAYMIVPAGSAPEFKCVTTEEYEANIPQAPDVIYFNDYTQLLPQDDYNYTGTLSIPVENSQGENVALQFYALSGGSDHVIIGPYSSSNETLNWKQEANVPFAYGSNGSWILNNWDGGEVYVTINIQYQYVSLSFNSAGVDAIMSSGNGLNYSNNIVSSESGNGIRILNMNGQTVLSSTGSSLDVTSLPKGVYIAVSNGKSLKIAR